MSYEAVLTQTGSGSSGAPIASAPTPTSSTPAPAAAPVAAAEPVVTSSASVSTPAPAAAPASTPAPAVAATPTPEATPTPAPAPTPAPSEPTLYDLPDGRKVDAATLALEFKQKFLPDYTKKAQELARIKSQSNLQQPQVPVQNQPQVPTQPVINEPWKDPNWRPQSYGEIISIAEQNALARIQAEQNEVIQNQQLVNEYVTSQENQIKAMNPAVNMDSIYAHATQHGFQDLVAAYNNFQYVQNVRMTAEKNALQNVTQRAADVVTAAPAGAPAVDDGAVDRSILTRFSSPLEMLRALKK